MIETKVLIDKLTSSSTEEEDSSSESSESSAASDYSFSDDDLRSAAMIELVRATRYLSERKWPEKMKHLTSFILKSDNEKFKQHARRTRQAFLSIVDRIKRHPFGGKSRHEQANVEHQFLVALGRLGFDGNASSLWKVGSDFGIGEGTVNLNVTRVIRALLSLESEVVSWPNFAEKEAIKRRIEDSSRHPSCVGFVDGTLVGLNREPDLNGEDYFTRKGSYALNVMLVCDDQRRIRHVSAGFPGCSHDSRVFSYSKLARNSSRYFSKTEYLLADSAYPVSDITVPSYEGAGSRTAENEAFNLCHSRTRIVVKHTNGVLKGRFQSLKSLRLQIKNKADHAFAVYWVKACCVLHNSLQEDEYDESWTFWEQADREDNGVNAETTVRGKEKRERVKHRVLDLPL